MCPTLEINSMGNWSGKKEYHKQKPKHNIFKKISLSVLTQGLATWSNSSNQHHLIGLLTECCSASQWVCEWTLNTVISTIHLGTLWMHRSPSLWLSVIQKSSRVPVLSFSMRVLPYVWTGITASLPPMLLTLICCISSERAKALIFVHITDSFQIREPVFLLCCRGSG